MYGFGTRQTSGFDWVGFGIAGALELVYRKGEMVFIRIGFGLLWLERGCFACILRTILTPEVTLHSTTNAQLPLNQKYFVSYRFPIPVVFPMVVWYLQQTMPSRPKRHNACSHPNALLSHLYSSHHSLLSPSHTTMIFPTTSP
jgi:hypothetical protein